MRIFNVRKISLLGILSLLLLTGCANLSGDNSDKIKLKIGFWPETSETKDVAMYKEWKSNFEKDYPQYEIVGEPYKYDTSTVGQKFMTGTLPTVFQTWFTEPEKLIEKKFIRSIDEQVKNLGWDKMMDPDMKNTLTFDDKIYGIPRDGYGLGLLINIKTLGDNGLLPEDENGNYLIYNEDGSPAYPTTFDEIYEASLAIQEYDETKGILICSANKNGGWQFSNIAWNFGASLQHVDENGKIISTIDSDESVAALKWIQKMKQEELLINNISVYYDEWYNAIQSKVAMAIVGSDVLHLAYTNAKVDMKYLAFVPMPTGDGEHHYSLYGGTPYVFSSKATDEEVEGILKFFEYIGRSPKISDISKAAMELGNTVATDKGQPIVPKIMPWINEEYVEYTKKLEEKYVTVNMDNYGEFFEEIEENKHAEVQYAAQEMYEFIDSAIQNVLKDPETANAKTLLQTANSKMQNFLDENYNR